MSYVIGIDIGGTFTDAVAASDDGVVTSVKTPSTPPHFEQGFFDVLDELASLLEISRSELLAQTRHIAHGTTSALNALVTGEVATVGFLTTRGHADSLVVMNVAGRYAGLGPDEIQDIAGTNKPKPLIPKRFIGEIDERLDYRGEVVVALDESQAEIEIRRLVDEGADAIAISLLWSFLNPMHERRLRELVQHVAPDMYVALSSEICPRIREYARGATTVMSAQVGPRLEAYLGPLDEKLRESGFAGALLVMQGSGHTVVARDAARNAISTIGSVLTGGAIGAVSLGHRLGHRNIISTDMGGTTFLVGLIVDGQPLRTTNTILNQHTISAPSVDIHTIGAGGGAIAWVDGGGNLRVGPRSAGARPGPACYGQGGTEPTVTDANLVLGVLDPKYFLGGRKPLSPDLAERALKLHVADRLGLSVEDAAAAIRAVQNAQTGDLLRRVCVNAGYDPRDFVVYAFGGGGPAHCVSYSEDLQVKSVVVPLGRTAAAFSAFGLASADVGLTAELSSPENFPVPAESINRTFSTLEGDLVRRLEAQDLDFAEVTLDREIDIRYTMQLAEVSTPVNGGLLTDQDVAATADSFERLYEQLFGEGTGFRDAGLQFITYRSYATGHLDGKPGLPAAPGRNGSVLTPKGQRRAFFDHETGWVTADVYDYAALHPADRISGPAIIEAPTTTIVIPTGRHGEIDPLGNLVIDMQSSEARSV